jgi:hypothetical protein
MRPRVSLSSRSFNWLLTLAAILVPVACGFAQTFIPPLLPRGVASSSPDAAVDPIGALLSKGQSLETSGRWAEALSYYEEALREHPQDVKLQDRFDVARLHYSLEQRYDDRSFRESIHTLRPQQSLAQYNDLLTKINAHYYTTPPWQALVRRGARSMDIALTDENFLRSHAIRASADQVAQARAELVKMAGRYRIQSSQDAAAVVSQMARLANQRIGLNETATYLEFTAAAAGGLDHYSAFLTADQLRDIY